MSCLFRASSPTLLEGWSLGPALFFLQASQTNSGCLTPSPGYPVHFSIIDRFAYLEVCANVTQAFVHRVGVAKLRISESLDPTSHCRRTVRRKPPAPPAHLHKNRAFERLRSCFGFAASQVERAAHNSRPSHKRLRDLLASAAPDLLGTVWITFHERGVPLSVSVTSSPSIDSRSLQHDVQEQVVGITTRSRSR